MRDHQASGPGRSDILAWSGTLVLGTVGIGLVAIWLAGRAAAPAVPDDALGDILQGAVGIGGLLCVLAVGVGAAMLREPPLSARSHRVRRDPSRHGALARSTVSASVAAPVGEAAASRPVPPARRARHL